MLSRARARIVRGVPPRSGSARLHIAAPPAVVYDLVSDVLRMGEWSPETTRAEWRRGATGPAVGARFRGWNKRGRQMWFTDPIVEAADPGRRFSFVTTVMGRGRFTRWTYELSPASDGGTDVEESWEQVGSIPLFSRFFVSERRVQQLQAGMEETLQKLKTAAERIA